MTPKEAYRIYTWSVENGYPWGYYTVDGPVDGPEDLCSMGCYINDLFHIVTIGRTVLGTCVNPRDFVRIAASQQYAALSSSPRFSDYEHAITPGMLKAVVESHLRNS